MSESINRCPSCGAPAAENDMLCPNCGALLLWARKSEKQAEQPREETVPEKAAQPGEETLPYFEYETETLAAEPEPAAAPSEEAPAAEDEPIDYHRIPKTCPKCGFTTFKSSVSFCPTCAKKLVRPNSKPASLICSGCGRKPSNKDENFCAVCGTPISVVCPVCGAHNRFGSTYCSACQSEFPGEFKPLDAKAAAPAASKQLKYHCSGCGNDVVGADFRYCNVCGTEFSLICPVCGSENKYSSKTCSACGFKLVPDAPGANASSAEPNYAAAGRACSNCGYVTRAHDINFCPSCGNKLSVCCTEPCSYYCPGCGNKTNSSDYRYCNVCGSEYKPVCPICGAENKPGAKECKNCSARFVDPITGRPYVINEKDDEKPASVKTAAPAYSNSDSSSSGTNYGSRYDYDEWGVEEGPDYKRMKRFNVCYILLAICFLLLAIISVADSEHNLFDVFAPLLLTIGILDLIFPPIMLSRLGKAYTHHDVSKCALLDAIFSTVKTQFYLGTSFGTLPLALVSLVKGAVTVNVLAILFFFILLILGIVSIVSAAKNLRYS